MRYYTEAEVRNILQQQLQKRGDQARLARQLGFTPQFLNDVVHGRRAVTAELAQSMGYYREPTRFVRGDKAKAKGMVEVAEVAEAGK